MSNNQKNNQAGEVSSVSKKWGTCIFLLILVIMVLPPLLTLLRQQPTLTASIKTWSMLPDLTRGDMVFLLPVGKSTKLSQGQIIAFSSPEHGISDWTMHRIVGGDAESGFITKGDANKWTDQEGSGYPPIKQEWIGGVVPTLGSSPLKVPLVGYLPLWLEENVQSPIFITIFLLVLVAVLLLDEIFRSKKRRKKEALKKQHLYFIGGMAFAVLMGAIMLMGSLFVTIPYGVSSSPAVLMGSDVGVLATGTNSELTLAKVQKHGGVPSFYLAASYDPQVQLEQDFFFLRRGEETELKATLYAREEGSYQANITLLMVLPFLPPGIIELLAGTNIWLAFSVVSLLPALPLFILPYLERRSSRRFTRGWQRRMEHTVGLVR
jgi:signal peptidase